jgi:hypothetical protein
LKPLSLFSRSKQSVLIILVIAVDIHIQSYLPVSTAITLNVDVPERTRRGTAITQTARQGGKEAKEKGRKIAAALKMRDGSGWLKAGHLH